MHYYQSEHESAYRRITREHKTQWNDLFDGDTISATDNFPIREFLERVLSRFAVGPDALEYGCGTGLAASFLAQQGFRVDAVDLVPRAIDLPRALAHARGIEVNFAVQDVCHGGHGAQGQAVRPHR
jgi:2-polyprenyl-3-methyl-5-hydroxy-6-metoxy-1,4-benzoquinol methylase